MIKNNLIIIYQLTETINTKLKKMFNIECYIYKTWDCYSRKNFVLDLIHVVLVILNIIVFKKKIETGNR